MSWLSTENLRNGVDDDAIAVNVHNDSARAWTNPAALIDCFQ